MKNSKQKNVRFLTIAASIILLLSAVLVSCGRSTSESGYKEEAYVVPTNTAPAPEMNGGSYDYRKEAGYPADSDSSYREDGEYHETSPEEPTGNEEGKTSDSIMQAMTDEKLVYTCQITLETTAFKDTSDAVRQLISKYQGFIEQDSVSDSGSDWYYENYRKTSATLTETMVIRIPSKNYTDFLSDLDGQGKIRSKQQQVENITQSYYDTETTIKSLKTQEERLLEMMRNADTIEDMLTVEARLSEVQNELAIYQNRLNRMDRDVAYSTVTLQIREVLEYTKDKDPVKVSTFGDRLKNTLKESWATFLGFLEGLLFFIIRFLPILLVIALIVIAVIVLVKKILKKKSMKKVTKGAVYVSADKEEALTEKTPEEKASE